MVGLLAGCSNVIEPEEEDGLVLNDIENKEFKKTVEEVSSHDQILEQLDDVAILIGFGEIWGAKLELANAIELIELEGLKIEDYPEIQELEMLIASAEETSPDHQDAHGFSGPQAVQIAIEAYGSSDDIVYMYDQMPEHYGDDLIGYYVALKSKQLEEEGAEDPIVLMLFVGEDGSIAEL